MSDYAGLIHRLTLWATGTDERKAVANEIDRLFDQRGATIAAQAERIKELEAKVYQQQLDFAQWPSQTKRIAALTVENADYAKTVSKVWAALGIASMDEAGGKTIWELVIEVIDEKVQVIHGYRKALAAITAERDALREQLRWRVWRDEEPPRTNMVARIGADRTTYWLPLPPLPNEKP